MKITSAVFKEGEEIPKKYTCEGEDISPPLTIGGVPKEAKSLAIIVDDPDVPSSVRADRMWVHWLLYNLSPLLKNIEEGRPPEGEQGENSAGRRSYMGPCPPDREHRYFFKLYALDSKLSLLGGATKKELLHAMQGHILQETQLMGRYALRENSR